MALYDSSLSHFDLDRERGEQGELFVRNVRKAFAENGRVETKTDAWAIKTGRIYVELECRGRNGTWYPSGLATTRAELWAFVLGKHPGMYVVETAWLKRAVPAAIARDKRNAEAKCKYGENPTRGVYVYPIDFLNTRNVSQDEH
jgi:hypothetical protein